MCGLPFGTGCAALGALPAEDAARIGAHVRTLVAASRVIRDAAHCGRCHRHRQIVQILCNWILTELAVLTDPRSCRDTPALHQELSTTRLGQLLLAGKALADDCEAGAFDDPAHGWARLLAHVERLGPDYKDLLQRIAILDEGLRPA